MPCTDPYAEEQSRREMITNLKDRTRMLCGLCNEIERRHNELVAGDYFHKVPGLAQWWRQHKEQDRLRKSEEKRQRRLEIANKRDEILRIQNEITKLEEGDD